MLRLVDEIIGKHLELTLLQISWLNEVLGEQMRSVYVVRDPRDWIYSLIRDDLTMDKMRMLVIWTNTTLLLLS